MEGCKAYYLFTDSMRIMVRFTHNWIFLLLHLPLSANLFIFQLHFIMKNDSILSVVQVVQILRAP
jgi:hypothetical protein